jgi:hypothetical protein
MLGDGDFERVVDALPKHLSQRLARDRARSIPIYTGNLQNDYVPLSDRG